MCDGGAMMHVNMFRGLDGFTCSQLLGLLPVTGTAVTVDLLYWSLPSCAIPQSQRLVGVSSWFHSSTKVWPKVWPPEDAALWV